MDSPVTHCVNGHPMLKVAPICSQCGAPARGAAQRKAAIEMQKSVRLMGAGTAVMVIGLSITVVGVAAIISPVLGGFAFVGLVIVGLFFLGRSAARRLRK